MKSKQKLKLLNGVFFLSLCIIFVFSLHYSVNDFNVEYNNGFKNVESDNCIVTKFEERICYNTYKIPYVLDTGIPVIFYVDNSLENHGTIYYISYILNND